MTNPAGDHGEYSQLFAFVTEGEGIVSAQVGDMHFPLVTYREDIARQMTSRVETLVRVTQKRISLMKFSNAEVMETWEPK